MNYFELYNFPIQFQIDLKDLKQKYYLLSKQYHPDLYTNSSEEEKTDILEKSAAINNAYKIFQNKEKTIQYILELKQLIEQEEKYNLDSEFLMEVMDINESLMEGEIDPSNLDWKLLEDQTNALNEKIYLDVAKILETYKDDIHSEKELLQVKDYYYKKKYIQRILDRIASTRNIASPN